MSDLWKAIIPATVGFIGTVIVVVVGYRQWKRQHYLTKSGSFLSEKQAAYKSIWQKLETAHLYVRSEVFDREYFNEIIRDMNIEIMQSSLYLDHEAKKLVNEYLQSLISLGKAIMADVDESVQESVDNHLYLTLELPDNVIQKSKKLGEAYMEVDNKREKIIERFRRAIGAEIN